MTKSNASSSLIFLWLFLAVIATYTSTIMSWHIGRKITLFHIFDLSFYHFIPALLWSLLTPILLKLAYHFPLNLSYRTHFFIHLGIATIFAPFIRFFAIYIDFSLKYLSGMNSTNPMQVVQEVNLVILATIPQSFGWYWFLIGIGSWLYHQEKKKAVSPKKLTTHSPFLTVNKGAAKKLIPLTEIDYIQAAGNYVEIYSGVDTFRKRTTLKQLTKALPSNEFLRIHRSIVINIKAIQQVTHWRRGEYLLVLKNKKTLSSSRSYRQQMAIILGKGTMKN